MTILSRAARHTVSVYHNLIQLSSLLSSQNRGMGGKLGKATNTYVVSREEAGGHQDIVEDRRFSDSDLNYSGPVWLFKVFSSSPVTRNNVIFL